MKLLAVSLLDKKAGLYGTPDFFRSKVDAMRSWEKMVNEPNYKYNTHPEDFCILELGTYDDETGIYDQHSQPQPIASGLDVIRVKQ